ncbi:thiolase family protein [Glaciibacter psychrotolerans]|uniref:Acetyl-CoA C-acetyltransferase n=1 Tax=Glaciibacter psychrotolerans TaxID=670054 RepID=A0A7Z0ECV8_9MICO|nr:thiolase family protein [Leifsonia psychrotolerans]NYJ18689.1 acetyl-CoA C-acetyltransferase [Leifsonia psychrotolerans]
MADLTAPVVIAARRTPLAIRGARLAQIPAEQLAAAVIGATVQDARAQDARAQDATAEQSIPRSVGGVILGNCMGPGGNLARLSALAAGLDVKVPGMTVDTQCGSGLSAILSTAAEARLDATERVWIAGGTESASTAPTRSQAGRAYARAPFTPAGFPDPDMGSAAQALAELDGIDRRAQDAYAERSHRLALAAQAAGRFDAEIVALGHELHDHGPRNGMRAMLPRFPALFASSPEHAGTVTAGNSSRNSDGAAAVAIVAGSSRGEAPGLALVASATIGCDPSLPGIGPVDAVLALLAERGVSLDDVAAVEIVEAFAAQTLAVLGRLGLAPGGVVDSRVCADGGALALGHPWGASGAVSVVRLFSRLVRGGAPAGTLGVATAAIGGGMGVAALFEVVR